ncbi:hypothetical protein J7E62_28640 [Variovorax paradoxus]|nr:hypothetical protein [Variovorax paradoxus]
MAAQHIGQVTELRPYQSRRQQWLSQTLADLAFAQGRDDEAYEILRNWAAESPNNGRPYLMLAAIDALHGRTAAATANMARHRQMLPLSNVAFLTGLRALAGAASQSQIKAVCRHPQESEEDHHEGDPTTLVRWDRERR